MCDFDDFDFGWEDMAIAGSLAEEMTNEKQRQSDYDQEMFDLDRENEEYESGKNL